MLHYADKGACKSTCLEACCVSHGKRGMCLQHSTKSCMCSTETLYGEWPHLRGKPPELNREMRSAQQAHVMKGVQHARVQRSGRR